MEEMLEGAVMTGFITKSAHIQQQKQQDERLIQVLDCEDRKHWHELNYQRYCEAIDANWKEEFKEIRGWGIVKPVMDLKSIGPLCRYPYHGHVKGCKFCRGGKRYWYDIADKNEPLWALYFSMDLKPLWTKLKNDFPWWTRPQIQNNRYWTGTKKKLIKEIELEFLETHPGPWVRILNRAPGHITYAFGIHYNDTMKQIGVYLKWPPEPHPITVQFLGRPIEGVDYSWGNFILDGVEYKLPPHLKGLSKEIGELKCK